MWCSRRKEKYVLMSNYGESIRDLRLSKTTFDQVLEYAEKRGLTKWTACRELIDKGLEAIHQTEVTE